MAGAKAGAEAARRRFAADGAAIYAKALPIAREMRAAGASYDAIAARLNGDGITTPRGAAWAAMQVSWLLNRE